MIKYRKIALIAAAVLFIIGGAFMLVKPEHDTVITQYEGKYVYEKPSEQELLNDERINVNTASKEELIRIPGIAEVLADRIIEYRTANGPFSSLDELTNVKGIGEKSLARMRGYMKLEG